MPLEILWDRVVAHSDPIKGFFGKVKRKGVIPYDCAEKANSSSVILFHAIAEIPLDVQSLLQIINMLYRNQHYGKHGDELVQMLYSDIALAAKFIKIILVVWMNNPFKRNFRFIKPCSYCL